MRTKNLTHGFERTETIHPRNELLELLDLSDDACCVAGHEGAEVLGDPAVHRCVDVVGRTTG